MSRILHRAVVDTAPVVIAAPTGLPAELRLLVDEQVARAREVAHAQGVAEGRRIATAERDALVASLRACLADGLESLRTTLASDAEGVLELALQIATAVVDAQPAGPAAALLDRVRDVLQTVDDAPLQVRCHPSRVEHLRDPLSHEGVDVRADTTFGPDDVVVSGPWSRAVLTRAAALAAVRESLLGRADL